MLGNVSVAVWRCFLIFKWFNLCNVKLHGNNLSDSGFPASDELQPCKWFSFSSDKVQRLVTLTDTDMTGLTGSSFFFLFLFPSQIKEVAVLLPSALNLTQKTLRNVKSLILWCGISA